MNDFVAAGTIAAGAFEVVAAHCCGAADLAELEHFGAARSQEHEAALGEPRSRRDCVPLHAAVVAYLGTAVAAVSLEHDDALVEPRALLYDRSASWAAATCPPMPGSRRSWHMQAAFWVAVDLLGHRCEGPLFHLMPGGRHFAGGRYVPRPLVGAVPLGPRSGEVLHSALGPQSGDNVYSGAGILDLARAGEHTGACLKVSASDPADLKLGATLTLRVSAEYAVASGCGAVGAVGAGLECLCLDAAAGLDPMLGTGDSSSTSTAAAAQVSAQVSLGGGSEMKHDFPGNRRARRAREQLVKERAAAAVEMGALGASSVIQDDGPLMGAGVAVLTAALVSDTFADTSKQEEQAVATGTTAVPPPLGQLGAAGAACTCGGAGKGGCWCRRVGFEAELQAHEQLLHDELALAAGDEHAVERADIMEKIRQLYINRATIRRLVFHVGEADCWAGLALA